MNKSPLLAIKRYGNSNLPNLVLLHGFLGNKDDWCDVVLLLKNHFHCICVDFPGHGDSDNIFLPIPGFESCADLVIQTLKYYAVEQFHLLGYSLGGRIALHIAQIMVQQTPKKLLSLQLESCHPGLLSDSDKYARKKNDQAWAEKLAQLPIKQFLSLWYQQAVFNELTSEQKSELVSLRSQNNADSLLTCYQATSLALQNDMWQLPLLLIDEGITTCFYAGSKDSKFSALAKKWQNLAQIKVISIENLGHNIHKFAPELFSKALINQLM